MCTMHQILIGLRPAVQPPSMLHQFFAHAPSDSSIPVHYLDHLPAQNNTLTVKIHDVRAL